jgi:hypothetical protein
MSTEESLIYRQRRQQRRRSSSEAEPHLIGWWGAATKVTAGCDNTGQSDMDGRGLWGRTALSLLELGIFFNCAYRTPDRASLRRIMREVDLAPFIASGLLRELLQLPACLPLMEAACLVLFHPSAYVVLESSHQSPRSTL